MINQENIKKLLIGIDEFTVVLQTGLDTIEPNHRNWSSCAESIIDTFVIKADFENLLGEKHSINRNPAGYTTGFTFGDYPFYLAVAYNSYHYKMGVICKFSAHAWAEYCRRYEEYHNEEMYVYTFLKLVQSKRYTTRLSRIDFTADYFNYGLSVHEIYYTLKGKTPQVTIKTCNGKRKNISTLSALEREECVETFYKGSRKANATSLLRVYNKRLQQLETHGYQLQEALNCDDWIRFEVSFKGTYAHQLTEIILNDINTPIKLQKLIADKILEKYSFYKTTIDELADFSQELFKLTLNNSFPSLTSVAPMDNELIRSVNYLQHGSGLFPTLYKIEKVWRLADAVLSLV